MSIEERKRAILAKIEEMKTGASKEALAELDKAYREGVDSL